MIPIKINGKKYQIKAIEELTTSEYIEINRIEDVDIIKYLSWATKIDHKTMFVTKVSDHVIELIGQIPDITEMEPPKYLLNKHIKSYSISTVGQRFQIETTTKYKGFDLLVFITAVALVNSPDIGKVQECMGQLYKLPFKDVLPAGNFFFQSLSGGKRTGTNFLLRIVSWMKMKFSRKGPG